MRHSLNIALLFACCASVIASAQVRAEDSIEYKIKAAFLYKFLKFVEWPPEAFHDKSSPVIIGVLGSDPFGDLLDQTVRDRDQDGRKIVVRRYTAAKAAREAHVLFINLPADQLPDAVKELEGAPVLTVGESLSVIEAGVMVRFVIRDEKVAFDINPEPAKKAGLKVGAQLLRVAHVVNGKGD
jgi:hypothetical protein